MKNLDKWIAVVFLVISIAYGYSAATFKLLPFELNMVFLPNTLPNALAVISGMLCLLIILTPSQSTDNDVPSPDQDETGTGDVVAVEKPFEVAQAAFLVIAMIGFALAIRPVGFLTSTTVFLVVTGWILGERKLVMMIPIAAFSAFCIWYLVQETLGLYLRPLPGFLN
jgi:putative tricarboxylic transport membrane protein